MSLRVYADRWCGVARKKREEARLPRQALLVVWNQLPPDPIPHYDRVMTAKSPTVHLHADGTEGKYGGWIQAGYLFGCWMSEEQWLPPMILVKSAGRLGRMSFRIHDPPELFHQQSQ